MTNTPDQIQEIAAAVFIDTKPEILLGLSVAFIIAVTVVFLMVRQRRWNDFSLRYKWVSRFILLVLSLFIAVPALFLPANAVSSLVVGKITMESPNLTATAIKLGLYSAYRNYEISSRVAPEKRHLVECVTKISDAEAQKLQKNCNDDKACLASLPVMDRNVIVAKIKEALRMPSSEAYSACKAVDVSKID